MFEKYKHIHFVGIGGIGMSGIAQVLLTLGYVVSGSDLKKSATTTELSKKGAKIRFGHKSKNIAGADVVVISSAVGKENPEVVEARKLSIPVVPRAEMLAELMRLKYGIAIAGTHGKTTTTSLVATVLTSAGLDPTMVIGGKVNSFKSNARLGKGEFLVAEADESDRSFLKLDPTIAVITNIDPEHMENYRDFDHVKETYADFANKVPFYGSVIACVDHEEVRKLLPRIERKIVTYGVKEGDFTADKIKQDSGQISFNAKYKGKLLGEIKLAIPGWHNVLNSLATIAVAMELDVPFAKIQKGFASFKGIERRFQVLSSKKNSPVVVTDYAHHPREIEAVLDSARVNWKDGAVLCVVQPHRYTRLASLFKEFVDALMSPDALFILPVYAAGEKPIDGASSLTLFDNLARRRGPTLPTFYSEDNKMMFKKIKEMAGAKDIILFLGAGDVWKVAKEFAKMV